MVHFGCGQETCFGKLDSYVAFIKKGPGSVALNLALNHLYYGLGKLPVTSTPLYSNQKLLLGTIDSTNKAVIKKIYNEGVFGSTPEGKITDNTRILPNTSSLNQ